jgi:hypothetical protein
MDMKQVIVFSSALGALVKRCHLNDATVSVTSSGGDVGLKKHFFSFCISPGTDVMII